MVLPAGLVVPPKMEKPEGQDIFAEDFIRLERLNKESGTPSEIQKFFEGTTILITGGTGFIGKILIEKLLRACWGIKKIYILIRPKKGKSVEERFEEQFEDLIFYYIKKQKPEFADKVSLVQGDMGDEKGILSEEDKQKLIPNIDIIFHCAATVRFDEKIRRAVSVNVYGTKYLLDMAREMKNLKAFVHVSTAYSNCIQKEVKEQFYTPKYDYKKIKCLLEALDDNVLDKITPEIIEKFPNTYAFSKMISEDIVREFGKGLPVGILRPSIVISTWKEPISGWINNYYGPQGVVFGAALGLLRTLHCNPDIIADLVPADFVVNAIIALAWDIGQTKGDNPNFENVLWKETLDNNSNIEKTETLDEIPILNYVSSVRNPITWGGFLEYNYKNGHKNYSPFQMWYSSLTLNKNYYVDRVYRVFCHSIPAIVVDSLAIIMQKKPQLREGYKKIHKFSGAISYFCTSQWQFSEDNVEKLWKKLSPKDKDLFNFNIEQLNWEEYFQNYITGMRVYLFKDSPSSHPEGKKRAFRLKVYHFTLLTVLNLFMFYILYRIFCYLYI